MKMPLSVQALRILFLYSIALYMQLDLMFKILQKLIDGFPLQYSASKEHSRCKENISDTIIFSLFWKH